MGRDQLGGESVNLTPCDTPRDTYTNFANFIEKLRVEDAAKGNLLAQKLEGLITRKVRTFVYSLVSTEVLCMIGISKLHCLLSAYLIIDPVDGLSSQEI